MIRVYFRILIAYSASVVYSVVRAAYDASFTLESKAYAWRNDAADNADDAVGQHFSVEFWEAGSPGEELAVSLRERDLRDRFHEVLRPYSDFEDNESVSGTVTARKPAFFDPL